MTYFFCLICWFFFADYYWAKILLNYIRTNCAHASFLSINLATVRYLIMGAKALINAHPKNVLGSKGARRCRVCGTNYNIFNFYILPDHNRSEQTVKRDHHASTKFIFSLLPISLLCQSITANPSAIIRKYHLDMCRQCFRERAIDIGFVKVWLNIYLSVGSLGNFLPIHDDAFW